MINSAQSMTNGSIKVLEGGLAVDDRGAVRFVNDFNFNKVVRFYQVENFDNKTIRAFHGHFKEAKYVYVANGSALICLVKLTDKKQPSKRVKVNRFVLSSKKPKILYVPPGHANGFRVLENNTQILFFSTKSLKQTQQDDYRFPYDYWGKSIWKVENR